MVSSLPKERHEGLAWSTPISVPLAVGLSSPFGGTLLFATVLFILLRKNLPPQTMGAGPGPLCRTLGWRSRLRRLSFFQGDHHLTPRSRRARQAHRGPLGLLAPSAALAWRFSSTSLSTCRVSARVRVGCVHACVPLLEVSGLCGQAQVFHPCS